MNLYIHTNEIVQIQTNLPPIERLSCLTSLVCFAGLRYYRCILRQCIKFKYFKNLFFFQHLETSIETQDCFLRNHMNS